MLGLAEAPEADPEAAGVPEAEAALEPDAEAEAGAEPEPEAEAEAAGAEAEPEAGADADAEAGREAEAEAEPPGAALPLGQVGLVLTLMPAVLQRLTAKVVVVVMSACEQVAKTQQETLLITDALPQMQAMSAIPQEPKLLPKQV